MPEAAWSQVIPDESTATTTDSEACTTSCTIRGGIVDPTGNNLFHSFEQLSVPNGGELIFEHSPTINHIVTRVAGGNPSIVDGFIRTDTASDTNLFLLNPSGIIFGPNGGLDLGGSFVATTADAIEFGSQGSFSAFDQAFNPTLLTVNPSALSFTQAVTQPIINQSVALNSTGLALSGGGLTVQANNSLLLVGGEIVLELPELTSSSVGALTAPSGRIELGGVTGPGLVGVDVDGNNLSLSYGEDTTFADISISNFRLNVAGAFGGRVGDIKIQADSLSFLDSVIDNTTVSAQDSGNISISADDSVVFQNSGIISLNLAAGAGSNLEIITRILSLENSSLFFSTFGEGDAGNLSLNAESLSLSGRTSISSDAQTFFLPAGSAGEIDIQAFELTLSDNAAISTRTTGDAIDINASGGLDIDVRDSLVLMGESEVTSETLGQRNASNISISTNELIIQDSANITAATSDSGKAGNILIQDARSVSLSENSSISTSVNSSATGAGGKIDIDTDLLIIDDDAQLISNTAGIGDAGTIFIREAETISLSNSLISTETSAAGNGGNINLEAERLIADNGAIVSARSTGTGAAGDLNIQVSERLAVQNSAQFAVSGESSGDSGTLNVISALVVLNDGQLLASVQEGEDGNIMLNLEDVLVLRGESLISAEASKNANGGNVDITAPFIIALFPEGPNGSDILARADAGNGGRISIQTNNLFNIATNRADDGNMTNDLDATSGTGIDGEVIITSPEVNPEEGTARLPASPAEPDISQGCQADSSGNNGQFTNSGRGGLTPSPYDTISNSGIQEDILPPGQTIAPSANAVDTSDILMEAIGWQKNNQGDVVLVPQNPTYHSACQHSFSGGAS